MKIMHITFDMGIGGTESVIKEIIEGTNNITHEVICINGEIGSIGSELQKQGITHHVLKRNSGIDLNLIKSISGIIKERNIDIVHCHQYTPLFYGSLSSIVTNTKYIFTEHGRHHPDRKRWKALLANKIIFGLSKRNIAISHFTLDALRDNDFCPSRNAVVIYNGIKDIKQSSDNKTITKPNNKFVCVARFDKNKNQNMILQAIVELNSKGISVQCDFIGDGPELNNCKRLAESLKIQKQVNFMGFVDNPSSRFDEYTALILSSFTEGTSMVILEAFREGLPVIASSVGGTPELIKERVNGLLFDPYSIRDLTSSIESIIEEPKLASKISTQAQNVFMKNFTNKVMCDRYMDLYLS